MRNHNFSTYNNNIIQTVRGEYEEKSSAQAASKSHGRVHDALMQQKANGNIPGIIGRLGDLGAIEAVSFKIVLKFDFKCLILKPDLNG